MTNDRVGDIGFFHVGNFFGQQLDRYGFDRALKLSDFARPDNRRDNGRFVQKPRKGDLRARHTVSFCDFGKAINDQLIGFGGGIVFAFRNRVGFQTGCRF